MDEWQEEMTEARKEATRAPTVTRTRALEQGHRQGKGKGKGKGKIETRYCYACGEQGHIGVNCPYKWTNSIDEEEDQSSSWESELVGEKAEELASLEAPDDEVEWCWPRRNRIHYFSEDDGEEQ